MKIGNNKIILRDFSKITAEVHLVSHMSSLRVSDLGVSLISK